MKNISPALQNFLLNNTSFNKADLIEISLPNGTSLNVVSGSNMDIPFGLTNTIFYASKYGVWERGTVTSEASFQPKSNSMELRAIIKSIVLYPNTTTSLMAAIPAGLFNGATVRINTIFWPIGQPPSVGIAWGSLVTFVGQIGNAKQTGRSEVMFDVYDLMYLMNRHTPPNLMQSSCRHTLFDAGCTLQAHSYRASVTAFTGSTGLNIVINPPAWQALHVYKFGDVITDSNGNIQKCDSGGTSGASHPTWGTSPGVHISGDGTVQWICTMPDYYTLGYMVASTGQNKGIKRAVKLQFNSGGVQGFTMASPFPFNVAGGDTFDVFPGCNKTQAMCESVKFNNLIHIGSTPFVPDPTIAQ